MNKLIIIILMMVSVSVFAEKFLIKGKAVELEWHENHFTFKDNYMQRSEYHQIEYHLVSLNNVQRVCFIQAMPGFSALDMVQLNIQEPNDKTIIRWNCYRYHPDFFEIDY